MKKLLALLVTGVLVVGSFAACGGNDTDANSEATNTEANTEVNTEVVEDTTTGDVAASELETLINDIYAIQPVELMGIGVIPVDVTNADDVAMNMGLASGDKVAEAVRSESMVGSIAYSMVVARVNDAADAEAVATEMYDNIDMNKWICVGADTKYVATSGDKIVFFMIDSMLATDMGLEIPNLTAAVEDALGTVDFSK